MKPNVIYPQNYFDMTEEQREAFNQKLQQKKALRRSKMTESEKMEADMEEALRSIRAGNFEERQIESLMGNQPQSNSTESPQ